MFVRICLFLCFLCGATCFAAPPNIVLIFTDDQGYNDVGCFGSKTIKTPHMDKLATDGMKFNSFYSLAPVCSASRAALLTGCYPARVGVTGVYFPRNKTGLSPDEVTIAEVLKERGYATACVGKWHLGHHAKFLPTNQGFDRYFGIPYSNDMDPVQGKPRDLDRAWRENDFSSWNVPLMRDEEIIERPANQTTLTQRYTEEAIKFIEEKKDEPFFLYMPHTMPHIPMFVSKDFYNSDTRMAYKATIEEIDWSVGQVMAALQRLELDANTLVVFTTDNGPWLFGPKKRHHGGSAEPLAKGKFSTYEGGMRVPCIMRWPGKVPAGTETNEVAATFDLLPTFAKLASAGELPNKIDGRDIWPIMSGQSGAKSPHEIFCYYNGNNLQAVRQGKWKLHLARKDKVPTKLFDLESDIGEQNDVAASNPEVVKRLTDAATKFAAELQENRRPEGKL